MIGQPVEPALQCFECGTPIVTPRSKSSKRVFCSQRCVISARKKTGELSSAATAANRSRWDYQGKPSCIMCGVEFTKSYGKQVTCGRECGAMYRKVGRPGPHCRVNFAQCPICSAWFSSRVARRCCSQQCSDREYNQRVRPGPRATCPTCGVESGRAGKCCDACRATKRFKRRKADKLRRRALAKNAGKVERFSLTEIGDRDGWICGICRNDIRRDAVAPDPWAASVDHVVPLARGGTHTRDNVQMAHLWCNITKGSRSMQEYAER